LFVAFALVQADMKSFDCKMRALAMTYAKKIQPFRTKDQFQQIADALNGAQEAQNCNVSVDDIPEDKGYTAPAFHVDLTAGSTFYVDTNIGSDSNIGSITSPFKTIGKAIESSSTGSTIILRRGTFYLTDTLTLGSKQSGLTIQNYPNEEVWISGGKVISPKWQPYNGTKVSNANIYKADLSSEGLESIWGLRINTKRGIRARYPNADPEFGFGSSTIELHNGSHQHFLHNLTKRSILILLFIIHHSVFKNTKWALEDL
jgi:hypothetical protein